MTLPQKQGLYDPSNEHENCGIGLIVDMKGRRSHEIVKGALEICVNLRSSRWLWLRSNYW
jgi:glutamate synthase domain-containing protein 1